LGFEDRKQICAADANQTSIIYSVVSCNMFFPALCCYLGALCY